MTQRMSAILERVLSEEIAHQEIWKKKELETFGEEKVSRDEIIQEIKDWMKENDVRFNHEFYIRQF